ncbi:MAG: ParA family protein [Gammaproteobacteria bacterium]|nr:ParA family protein [Gammaproteobacteria bacterium]
MSKSTMKVISAYSSKGGTTKTTTIANLGGLLVDLGFRILLIDADNTQPSLSSYYPLTHQAPDGLVRLIKSREIVDDLLSHTTIEGLDIVYADDHKKELSSFINDAADGRLRIKRAIQEFQDHCPDKYDFILIDTRGAKGVLVDSALIASDIIFSPIPPDKISATEFHRGTVRRHRSIADSVRFMNMEIGPIFAFLCRVERTRDAQVITEGIRLLSEDVDNIYLLDTEIPHSTAYKSAATSQIPIHRFDRGKYKKIRNGADTMSQLWQEIMDLYRSLNPVAVLPIPGREGSHGK